MPRPELEPESPVLALDRAAIETGRRCTLRKITFLLEFSLNLRNPTLTLLIFNMPLLCTFRTGIGQNLTQISFRNNLG